MSTVGRSASSDRRIDNPRVMVQRFNSTAGVSRLAYELMNSTFRELPDVSERSAGGMADALSHLLQLAMLEKSGRPTDLTHRELLRDRIKQYVQTHLRDPDLSIHRIASRSR